MELCEIFGPRSGQLGPPPKIVQLCHGYSLHRISMKLTGLLEVISTFKMYVSEFLSWWPNGRSISWHLHYKPMGKDEHAFHFAWTDWNHPLLSGSWPLTPSVMSWLSGVTTIWQSGTDDQGSQWGHLRSSEVTICFSPISCDRLEIEMCKRCQTVWLIEPLQRMCILAYLGHDLTLTWPEVKFWNWPFKGKKLMFQTGSMRQYNGVILFLYLSYQKVINEKPSPWKTIIFHLMTSGAKTVDRRSNLIEKLYRGMKRAAHFLFQILPSCHIFF